MAKKASKKSRSKDLHHQGKTPHKSFHRTYREDYIRELKVPGMGQQIYETFAMIFRNFRVFGALVAIAMVLEVLAIGGTNETTAVFSVLIFLMVWLVAIFAVRHIKAGHQVTIRDALYNAMTPLMSSIVVLVVAVVECVPISIVVIAYSAAVRTDFLTMPFYALLFFVFAGLMLTLSGYLLSSSVIALIATSAPGVYPLTALSTASELMMGRRIRFILRLIALIMVVGVMSGVVVFPLVALKVPEIILSIAIAVVGSFGSVYTTVYLYLYYRYLLDA